MLLTLSSNPVARATEVLEKGGVVLYPTDTLYGLAVDATNADALAKLQKLKGRPNGKAFSIVVADRNMLGVYAKTTPLAERLIEHFLPGALTITLEPTYPFSSSIVQDNGVAFRIPDHHFCLELARVFGKPYTATSANVSGHDTLTTTQEIVTQFGDRASLIDLIVDAGTLPIHTPSTVVDARGTEPIVLRQGAIDLVSSPRVT